MPRICLDAAVIADVGFLLAARRAAASVPKVVLMLTNKHEASSGQVDASMAIYPMG